MHLTLYSILMANIYVSVFSLLFFSLRNNISFITKFGSNSLIIVYILCIFRILVPLELPFTKELCFPKIMNWWNHYLYLQVNDTSIKYIHIICCVCLIIAFILLLHFFLFYFKIVNVIKFLPDSTNKNIDKYISMYSENKRIKYYIISKAVISSPIQFGFINPVILFPDISFNDIELMHICHHECTHIKNRDNLLKTITKLMTCIFWWNPFCYLLLNEINRLQEYNCDYIVTNNLSQSEKASYLETLLKVYSSSNSSPFHASISFFAYSKKQDVIVNRFKLVATSNHPSYFFAKYSILLCIGLFICSYCFVIQPAFEPKCEEGVLLDSMNTILEKIDTDQYSVIIDGQSLYIISAEQAEKMHENGIPYYNIGGH